MDTTNFACRERTYLRNLSPTELYVEEPFRNVLWITQSHWNSKHVHGDTRAIGGRRLRFPRIGIDERFARVDNRVEQQGCGYFGRWNVAMQQVLQPIDGQDTEIADVPAPVCGPNQVLIANRFSLVSAGTEKSTVELAKQSLWQKARSRPDHVQAVLRKVRTEGVVGVVRQVRAKLAQPMPLGYSSAGVVVEVGDNVREFQVGDRVASNGCHAGLVAVGKNLVARVPDAVPLDHAAYAVIGSIAMQGVRLARVGLGDVVAVIGLGLIGQMCVALLKAAGCTVIGTDLESSKRSLAKTLGADAVASLSEIGDAVATRTAGRGADAVLIAASTSSNGPIELAARLSRQKGRVVAVGAVGMNVPRREFYPKELEFVVSCSYGPGRYDSAYEEEGRDYPVAYVRWTEQRNIQAVLDQMAAGRLPVEKLTTHRFGIDHAMDAYRMIQSSEQPYVGILLEYPPAAAVDRRVELETPCKPKLRRLSATRQTKTDRRPIGISVIGAGNFAGGVLLPQFLRTGNFVPRGLISAGGLTAKTLGKRHGFAFAGTSFEDVLADSATEAVVIATRHNQHAPMALAALKAGKRVFLEKPLAISEEQLEDWQETLEQIGDSCPLWTVGFNRRFSLGAAMMRQAFDGVEQPRMLTIRFNAGRLPAEHWTNDLEIGGGRIVGEACHAVDLATFLIGSPPVKVSTESVADRGRQPALDDNVSIALKHADGSVSTILYTACGDRAAGKERVEMFGGDRTAILDDFRNLQIFRNGKQVVKRKWWSQQKGYAEEIAAFADGVWTGRSPIEASDLLRTTSVCLRAMQSLRIELPLEVA